MSSLSSSTPETASSDALYGEATHEFSAKFYLLGLFLIVVVLCVVLTVKRLRSRRNTRGYTRMDLEK